MARTQLRTVTNKAKTKSRSSASQASRSTRSSVRRQADSDDDEELDMRIPEADDSAPLPRLDESNINSDGDDDDEDEDDEDQDDNEEQNDENQEPMGPRRNPNRRNNNGGDGDGDSSSSGDDVGSNSHHSNTSVPRDIIIPRTWEEIITDLNLHDYELASHLATVHANITPEEQATTFEHTANLEASGLDTTALVAEAAASPTARYFLVVGKKSVQVIYGLSNCYVPGVPGNGARYFFLMGEYTRPVTSCPVLPPELFQLAGQPNAATQNAAFAKVTINAPSNHVIRLSFPMDTTAQIFEPAGPNHPTTDTFKALPIHPSIAAMYLRGSPLKAAFNKTQCFLASLTVTQKHLFTPLDNFMRCALTSDEADPNPESALLSNFVRKDHGDQIAPGLRAWYYQLLHRFAPTKEGPRTPLPTRTDERPAPAPDSIQNLVDYLTENGPTRTHSDNSSASAYNKFDMIVLAGLSGIAGDKSTWGSLQVEVLPQFWQDAKTMRSKNTHLRTFLEGYIANSQSDTWSYQFLVTTDLINMIRSLVFHADDPERSFAHRNKGLSLWSLAPQSESQNNDMAARRQLMLNYEGTTANHRPDDLANIAKLSKSNADTPKSRFELFRWVDHSTHIIKMLFGKRCPILAHLEGLAVLLQKPDNFHNYSTGNWISLTWMIHLGIRNFFQSKGQGPTAVAIFQRLSFDMASSQKYGPDVLPSDHPFLTQAPPRGGGRGPPNPPPTGQGEQSPPPAKRQRATPKGSAMSAKFKTLIAQASAATPKLRASHLWKTTDDIKSLLGPQFLALIPEGKQPCLKYHIFGACANPGCNFCHDTTQEPTPDIVNGIISRATARVTSFVANPNV